MLSWLLKATFDLLLVTRRA